MLGREAGDAADGTRQRAILIQTHVGPTSRHTSHNTRISLRFAALTPGLRCTRLAAGVGNLPDVIRHLSAAYVVEGAGVASGTRCVEGLLTEAQKKELERRLSAFREERNTGASWTVVKECLRGELRTIPFASVGWRKRMSTMSTTGTWNRRVDPAKRFSGLPGLHVPRSKVTRTPTEGVAEMRLEFVSPRNAGRHAPLIG